MTNSNEAPDVELLNQINQLQGQQQINNEAGQDISTETNNNAVAAQAADVVETENEPQKTNVLLEDQELAKKEAAVINAEAANAVADGGKNSIKPEITSKTLKQLDQAALQQQMQAQFDSDKQSALDEGYTEEQAIQYAY